MRGEFAPASDPVLALDGIYGPQTAAAVEGIQKLAAISADGVVGHRSLTNSGYSLLLVFQEKGASSASPQSPCHRHQGASTTLSTRGDGDVESGAICCDP